MAFLFLVACDSLPKNIEEKVFDVSGAEENNHSVIEAFIGGNEPVLFETDFALSIRMATLSSPNSLAARKVYEASLQDIIAAESTVKPQVKGGIGVAGQTRGSMKSADSGAVYELRVQQLLLDGGRAKARREIALAKSAVAKTELVKTLNDEAKQVATVWARVWFAKEQAVKIEKRSKFIADSKLTLKKLFDSGVVDKLDELFIENALQDFELSKKVANQKVNQAEVAFRSKFNRRSSNLIRPTFSIKRFEGAELEQRVFSSPAIKISELDVNLAEWAYQLAKSEFKPTLSSSVGILPVTTTSDYGDANFSAGLNLSYNLLDGGRRKANLLSAKENLESRKLALTVLSESAYSQAYIAFSELDMIESKLSRVQKKLDNNKIKVEALRSQIVTGEANVKTLIEAEVQGFILEDEILEIEEEKLLAEIVLASKLGLLSEHFRLEWE